MDDVFAFAVCIEFADGAFVGLGWIGCADEGAEVGYGVFFFKDDGYAWA